ncbi:MAG: membrane protein insertase YidC [Paludibacteraceae bacterium]|nr:membrane protein insertase YidC [Paludibacteraceae bacterium]
MDKNTLIGLLLIIGIIVGFSIINNPGKEMERRQAIQDSIRKAQILEQTVEQGAQEAANTLEVTIDSIDQEALLTDSMRAVIEQRELADKYDAFVPASQGTDDLIMVENSKLRLQFAPHGGCLYAAELKDYRTHDSLPLILFEGDESRFDMLLTTINNRVLHTTDLYFEPQPVTVGEDSTQTLTLRLKTNTDACIDFIYTVPKDDYMIGMTIQGHGLQHVIKNNISSFDINWDAKIRQQEKGRKFEERYAQLNYKYADDNGIEELSESKNDDEKAITTVQWVAFKDQFFSTVLIAKDGFITADFESRMEAAPYIKSYHAGLEAEVDIYDEKPIEFNWYLGPNKYKTLSAYNDLTPEGGRDLNLQKLVPLGSWWYAWVNRIAVIPIFNLFSRWFSSYGLIILLLTLIIKLVIFPLTFKSYKSSAKMRFLKPEIDKINEKYPQEKMQERQQATMALYRKAGVSPMSGCLPLLLQMPILIAMFSFFPTSIELRQQSFLWAHDLSTYDAVLTWNANIPIISWFFGNHISLFCLLMTITNIVYTHLNMQSQGGADQMKAMKWMMYLMPVFFLYIFNDYAAGLSYYYLISLLITIIQTMAIRFFIDDEKVLAQIHSKMNKNEKNTAKKSGFAARLEKMQREQREYARKMADERAKKYGR